jgi:hypothetical protein
VFFKILTYFTKFTYINEGRLEQFDELAISPWQAFFFWNTHQNVMGWLFDCNMGVAHFSRSERDGLKWE